jgi:hypothetical protein
MRRNVFCEICSGVLFALRMKAITGEAFLKAVHSMKTEPSLLGQLATDL